jgi:hypothetical protein
LYINHSTRKKKKNSQTIESKSNQSIMTFVRPLISIATLASVATATVFSLTVFDGQSHLNGQVVNAAGGVFYIGLSEPGTFCPPSTNCPGGKSTLFGGLDSLWVYNPFLDFISNQY